MYADYFRLKEASFSITPDPHYLYLSKRHREALAHLLYGAGGNGGFVQLTGEVGTGKTTICRAFMEQIPEQVDLALILNPALTVVELLQAICQEFHIPVQPGETSRMILVDKLNRYLLQAHANGRRPVLMIDEAQNLSADVLEQLRLLTNLETSKQKLLQIFLIGQPELQEMLQRKELRQLAQRITARYHLTPLNETETSEYIRHRLAVAGVERPLFSRPALRRIHRLSGGVPRLINMLCDRALLGAFATHRQSVDTSIVRRASAELQGAEEKTGFRGRSLWWLLPILALIVTLARVYVSWQDEQTTEVLEQIAAHKTTEPAATPPVIPSENIKPAVSDPPEDTAEPAASLPATIDVEDLLMDKPAAFNQLLSFWQENPAQSMGEDPCLTVETLGLRCHQATGTWNNIRSYQRPALLQLKAPSGATGYIPVTGLTQQSALLELENGELEVPFTLLDPYWYGDFTLLWHPPPTGEIPISNQSPNKAAQWLKQQLTDAGYADDKQPLADQIKAFQQATGLEADGIAGPNTLIHLNTRTGGTAIPRLRLEP